MRIEKVLLVLPLLIGALLVNKAQAQTIDWPNIPLPDNSKIIVVAENMVFNGVPMRIWEVKMPASPEQLISFYKRVWHDSPKGAQQGAPPFTQTKVNQATLLTRVEGDYVITIQFDGLGDGGALGYFKSLSKIASARDKSDVTTSVQVGVSYKLALLQPQELGRGFLLPPGAEVVNDIEAVDGVKKSRTIVASSDKPLQSVVRFYEGQLASRGWKKVFVDETGVNVPGLLYQKTGQEMNITVTRNEKNNSTAIVAVRVKKTK